MSFSYLEVTRGMEAGRRFPLAQGATSIGRSSQNTIVFPTEEKSVSSHHAIIYLSPERMLIQDLQSTNGTFVNEQKCSERELVANDQIGFGRNGPRLKIIVSDTELPLNKSIPAPDQLTGIKTAEENSYPLPHRSDASGSATLEFEQRLIGKDLDAGDMKRLLKNGKRFEKILDRGNLGATQTGMLRSVASAQRSMRRQWIVIVASILVVSIAGVSYFAIRAFHYRHLLNQARALKNDLDSYESKIAAAHADPQSNEIQLQRLIGEMEKKEDDYSSVQSKINENDKGKLYSDPLEQTIDRILKRYGESDYHIPSEMVDRVRFHLAEYSGSLHGIVERYLQRRGKYFPMIQKIFHDKNIPVELAYVAMLESGFNPMALSHAGARGLWQFMPETARRYGLTVAGDLDERIVPEKATAAAAQYFRELISIFGGKSSVMLCMAAYNAGEGRIIGALRKINDPLKNRDFWYIYRMGYLADETNEYIPRVMALMIISENPQQYGFNVSASDTNSSPESEKDFVEVDYRVK